MLERIHGLRRIQEIDPAIFEELESLRRRGSGYRITDDTMLYRPFKTWKVNRAIRPLVESADPPTDGWHVFSEDVRPRHLLVVRTGKWHDDVPNLWTGANALPMQLLCVQVGPEEYSCRREDVKADREVWASRHLRDEQLRQAGGVIVTLEAGVLYQLYDQAQHRGVPNMTDAPVSKTLIGFQEIEV